MNTNGVFVSLVVDDLDARDNNSRSGRISTYHATEAEIDLLLKLIWRLQQRTNAPKEVAPTPTKE